MMGRLPYSRQWIDQNDINAVTEVLNSDMITTGSKVKEFEDAVAKYVGSKYAVAVSSGTAALHLAKMVTNVGVITSPITFLATSNCAYFGNEKTAFVDIYSDTYNMNITELTSIDIDTRYDYRTIIPVDFAGQPCRLDEINTIANENDLNVIEDASHALGAEYKGKKVGSISELTVFSFHPVKLITTGEGGMITTNNKEYYDKLLILRNHGVTKDKMNKYPGDWYYEMQMLGYNYRITDFQCALGISQLNRLDSFIKRRREIAKIYNEEFQNDIVIPYEKPNVKSSYHLYVIQVESRDKVFAKLRKRGIGVQVHYIPVYKQPFYQTKYFKDNGCSVAEEYYKHCLSIPIFPKMTNEDVKRVVLEVKNVVK